MLCAAVLLFVGVPDCVFELATVFEGVAVSDEVFVLDDDAVVVFDGPTVFVPVAVPVFVFDA